MSIDKRYDFVLLFDVKNGNPNGDPDAGNTPRQDYETARGLVTDVCIKRKIRNFIGLLKEENPPFEIYVKEGSILNAQHKRSYEALGVDLNEEKEENKKSSNKKKKRKGGKHVKEARDWMCQNFYDVRTFGGVMSTEINCGQVRGPVQLTFAESIDPINPLDHTLTRVAVTNEEKSKEQDGDNREMGQKTTVPYALYRAHGFVSPALARKTGFSGEDLELLWQSLEHMFEHDRSSARGLMSTRKLIVFEHENSLGNAPAHELFELVNICRKNSDGPIRSYGDYEIKVDKDNLPSGVTVKELV